MFPVRCYNCGKVFFRQWLSYLSTLEKINPATQLQYSESEALNEISMFRICCRVKFLTYIDTTEEIE